MIEVTMLADGFTVKGHAEYAEHGRDIVCASVSVLSEHTAKALHRYGHASIAKDTGFMHVRLKTTNDTTDAFLSEFNNTIRTLAHQYSDYISFTPVGGE